MRGGKKASSALEMVIATGERVRRLATFHVPSVIRLLTKSHAPASHANVETSKEIISFSSRPDIRRSGARPGSA